MRSESHEGERREPSLVGLNSNARMFPRLRVKLREACSYDNDGTEHTLIPADLDETMEPTKDKKEEEQDPFDYEDLMLPEEDNEFKKDEKQNGGTKL